MVEDLKEFDKLIKEKKISDVDKMLEESTKVTKDIPDLKDKYDKIVAARGHVIEASVKIELGFDELITKTGGKDMVMDNENKQFHLITGAKKENDLGGLGFKDKVKIFKTILKKVDDEHTYTRYLQSKEWEEKNNNFINHFKKCTNCGNTEQLNSSHVSYENFGNEGIADVEVLCWHCQIKERTLPLILPNIPEPPLVADLTKIVEIRDIFAHVPISWFAKDLEFDSNKRYNHYFKTDEMWRNVSFAVKEFMSLQKEILALIPSYIKSVILRRELFSQILLGKSYNDAIEEARKFDSKEEKK